MKDSLQVIAKQQQLELNYGKRYISELVQKDILNTPELVEEMEAIVTDISTTYMLMDHGDCKKNERIDDWAETEEYFGDYLDGFILKIVEVVMLNDGGTIQTILGAIQAHIKLDDVKASVTIAGEILAYVAKTNIAHVILPESMYGKIRVYSGYELSDDVQHQVEMKMYRPPMLTEPTELTNNFGNVYSNPDPEWMILGNKANRHYESICLPQLNRMNKVEYSLDIAFLDLMKELPSFDIDTQEKQNGWDAFWNESQAVYKLLITEGNRFCIPKKRDKRGRTYYQG